MENIKFMAVNIYRNPFILGLWAPTYLLVGTVAITNDFLMGAMFIMATLGLLGAYVTEFPIVSGLYPNEVVHKMAVSSLLGIVFGLVLWALSLMVHRAGTGNRLFPPFNGRKIFGHLGRHFPSRLSGYGLYDS